MLPEKAAEVKRRGTGTRAVSGAGAELAVRRNGFFGGRARGGGGRRRWSRNGRHVRFVLDDPLRLEDADERVDALRAELPPRHLLHLLHGELERQTDAVRAGGGHGVEGVRQADDPG